MTQKVHTVNVIEYVNDSVLSVRAFTDNETGNREAEILFFDLVRKNDGDIMLDEDIEEAISDGFWNDDNGYEIYLVHSN